MEQFANEASALLNGAINNSVTSITVDNTVSNPSSGTFRALIDSEWLKVTAVSGATWTVVRGDGGSTAASHADDAPIYLVVTKESLDSLVTVQSAGTEIANRRVINFTGATVTDNSGSGRCDVAISGGPNFEAAITVPVLADFTWRNQGTATVTDTGNGLFLKALAASGDNIKGLEVSTGSPPWNVVARVIPQKLGQFNQCGLYFANSGSGKVIVGSYLNNVFQVYYYNSATSFNSGGPGPSVYTTSMFNWLKFNDDGTNHKIYYSATGDSWSLLASEASNTLFGGGNIADRVGFQAQANDGTNESSIKLVSWLFTSGSL